MAGWEWGWAVDDFHQVIADVATNPQDYDMENCVGAPAEAEGESCM